MNQPNPAAKQFIDDYLKACGYGLSLPSSSVKQQVKQTGNPVQDYVAAAEFGLKKPQL